MPAGGVRRKLATVFFLQVAALSLAVVLGVFGSGLVLKNVLMERALSDEMALFDQRLTADPGAAPPHTFNLRGYFVRDSGGRDTGQAESPPTEIATLAPGVHHVDSAIVSVKDRTDGRMYLVFAFGNITRLALIFGLVPLTMVLIGAYLVIWWTYRMSHRAVSPLLTLARRVETIDLNELDEATFAPEGLFERPDTEVLVLTNALQHLQQRLQRYVERERDFTRDASHELRTPVTVVQMASSMLLDDGELTDYSRRQVKRIQGAARDMQALIEALLVLARESRDGLTQSNLSINEIVADEVDRYRFVLRSKPVEIEIREQGDLVVFGSRSVAAVMIGNLIRNACAYTQQGSVTITVGADAVEVDDTGIGMSEEVVQQVFEPFYRAGSGRGGHGVGLTIVKRLSDRFGWPVEIDSEVGVGTKATIYFDQNN